MTLLQRARALDSLFRAAVDQDRLKIDIGRINQREKEAEHAANVLEKAATAAAELCAHGHRLDPEVQSALQALGQDLQGTSSGLAADPLAGAGEDLHRVVQRVANEAQRVSRSLSDAWRRLTADSARPNVDEEFIALLERAGLDVSELSREVESALARITILESRELPERGDVAAWHGAIARLERAVGRLGSIVPPGVREFIVQASSDSGAPLDRLTSEVQQFLEDTGLMARYRITQGRR